MIIGPNFVFAHMRKTGGTFVIIFLLHQSETFWTIFKNKRVKVKLPIAARYNKNETFKLSIDMMDIMDMHAGLNCTRKIDRSKFKFGFIRNPFDWYVSVWESGKKNKSFEEYMKTPLYDLLPPAFKETYKIKDVAQIGIGYCTFRFFAVYFKPNDETMTCLADIILKYEDGIREGLERIFDFDKEQRKFLYELADINVSKRRQYREYYTDELIAKVYKEDKLIFDSFNYEF